MRPGKWKSCQVHLVSFLFCDAERCVAAVESEQILRGQRSPPSRIEAATNICTVMHLLKPHPPLLDPATAFATDVQYVSVQDVAVVVNVV